MTKRVNRPYRKTGRKPLEPPANAATVIAALAGSNHSLISIARKLSTSRETLRRWLEERPDLAEAFAYGKDAERETLHNGLLRAAKRGNVVAAIFLLKARHGYREGDQSDTANKVSVTFNLPGAMKPEEFMKVINHEPPTLPVSESRPRDP